MRMDAARRWHVREWQREPWSTEAADAGRLLPDGEGAAVIGALAEAVQAALLAVAAVCWPPRRPGWHARAGRMLHVACCMLHIHIASRIAHLAPGPPACVSGTALGQRLKLCSRGGQRLGVVVQPSARRSSGLGRGQRLVQARTGRQAYLHPRPLRSLSLDSFLSAPRTMGRQPQSWRASCHGSCQMRRTSDSLCLEVACHVRRLGRLARSRRMSCKSPPSAIRHAPASSLSGALVRLAVCLM
jgi:hypothetical protein